MADKSGKTEQPTQRRLEKARTEGQFPAAKEFVSALQFMVFLALLGAGGAHWFEQFRQTTRSLLRLAFAPELHPEDLIHVMWQIFRQQILPLVMAGAGGGGGDGSFPPGDHAIRDQLQETHARFGALQPASRLKELPKQNLPALVQAYSCCPLSVGGLRDRAGQAGRFLALPMQSVESGMNLIAVADGTVLEGRGRLPGGGCVDLSASCSGTNRTCA